MALINCAECGKEVSDRAPICPHCGAPIAGKMKNETKQKSKVLSWTLGVPGAIFLPFFIYGIFASQTPEGKAKQAVRYGIERCWREQESKSLAPSEARFVAGACEILEKKFRDMYGLNP